METMRSKEELWSSQRTQFCQCMRARAETLTMGARGQLTTVTMTTMMTTMMTQAMRRRRSITPLSLNITHHHHLPDITILPFTTGSSFPSLRLRLLLTMDTITMSPGDLRIMELGVKSHPASMTPLTLMTADKMPSLLMPWVLMAPEAQLEEKETLAEWVLQVHLASLACQACLECLDPQDHCLKYSPL